MATTYYRRVKVVGTALDFGAGAVRWYRRCGRCAAMNRERVRRCRSCRCIMVARPKHQKDRSIHARIAAAEALLDKWVLRAVAVGARLSYYRGRVRALRAEAQRLAEGRPRPPKRPQPPTRGIVLPDT